MQRANEPAESYIVVQRLETAPSFTAGWNVNHGEEKSRDDLQNEDGERSAAEDVPPTRRVARHAMLRDFANGSSELQAPVEPFTDLSDHAHVFVFLSKAFVSVEADSLLSMETNSFRAPHGGVFPKTEAVGDPGVGNSPA